MKVTLIFSNLLRKKLDLPELVELDISSYRDIVSACSNIFPSLKSYIATLKNKNTLSIVDGTNVIKSFELDFKPKSNRIILIPTVVGGLASGFDSLGNLSIFYGSSSAISNQAVALTGLNKRILESSLFGQSQTAFDTAARASNRTSGLNENTDDPTTGFGSLSLTNAIGQNIPLNFGLVRTSGAVINTYIKHIQRGNIDNVKVSDYL